MLKGTRYDVRGPKLSVSHRSDDHTAGPKGTTETEMLRGSFPADQRHSECSVNTTARNWAVHATWDAYVRAKQQELQTPQWDN